MNTEFPLYDQMHSKYNPTKEISEEDKIFFTQNVKNLSQLEHEIIFALIRTHQVHNSNSSMLNILPYNGKNLKKGIKFDLDDLPPILKFIIVEFVKMHLHSGSSKNL